MDILHASLSRTELVHFIAILLVFYGNSANTVSTIRRAVWTLPPK